jgi:hypothetical protein
MRYFVNKTDLYHKHDIKTLGWEMTVCNALFPENGLCRSVLKTPGSFGVHLFHYLQRFIPLKQLHTVLEVGGGMGYLMRDFLSLVPNLKVTMLDICPFLLEKQKQSLAGMPVQFCEMDFLAMSDADLKHYDLVILNENLGDFPTLVASQDARCPPDSETLQWIKKVADYEEEFSLKFAANENINIGALMIVEKLCGARIPYIFLSEHSCETSHDDPSFPCLNFRAMGNPEKIALNGHDEYSIRFSHLKKIAQQFQYKVIRGPYTDFLYLNLSEKVKTALRCPTPMSDDQEIIQQFVYDLHKYEYMILINTVPKKG